MSQVRSTSSRRNAAWASSFERRGCPCRRAVRSPLSRARLTHTIAVETPTPNRSAACRADAEPLRRLPRRRACGRRRQHPLPQILAVSPRHDPLRRQGLRNHCSPRLGIPPESEIAESALAGGRGLSVASRKWVKPSYERWRDKRRRRTAGSKGAAAGRKAATSQTSDHRCAENPAALLVRFLARFPAPRDVEDTSGRRGVL